MRDYSKISPQFWIGQTGKAIRRAGPEATIVALYLMTCPQANMLGLYYLPEMYIAHETGLGLEGASKGLQSCIEAGFCGYDKDSEVVWVYEMAVHQVGDELKPNDLRVKGVQNAYEAVPANPYLADFFERYGAPFKMFRMRDFERGFEAPSEPLGSQEQEQEQEQEQNKSTHGAAVPAAVAPDPVKPESPRSAKSLGVRELVAHGVDASHAADWLKARKAKRLPLTDTALDGIRREATKAGMSLPAAVQRAAEEGWAGFKAEWIANALQPGKPIARQPQTENFAGRDYGQGGKL